MEINAVGVTPKFVTLKKQDSYMTVSYSPERTFIHNITSITIIVNVYNIHVLFNMGFGIK